MKISFLSSLEKYRNIALPEERLFFSNESPFEGINLPADSFFAFHAPEVFDLNYQTGTAYVIRLVRNDYVPIKIDVYQNYISKSPDTVQKSGPIRIEYHHCNELPGFMMDDLESDETEQGVRIKERIIHHLNEWRER